MPHRSNNHVPMQRTLFPLQRQHPEEGSRPALTAVGYQPVQHEIEHCDRPLKCCAACVHSEGAMRLMRAPRLALLLACGALVLEVRKRACVLQSEAGTVQAARGGASLMAISDSSGLGASQSLSGHECYKALGWGRYGY